MKLYRVTRTFFLGFLQFSTGDIISDDLQYWHFWGLDQPYYQAYLEPIGLIPSAFLKRFGGDIKDILGRKESSASDIRKMRKVLAEILSACNEEG